MINSIRSEKVIVLGIALLAILLTHSKVSCSFADETKKDITVATDSEKFFAGNVRLILPPVIYATPGIECNVYFDNIILTLNSNNYAFDVTCPKGLQFQERWTFTPTDKEAGDYPIVIEVRDDSNKVVARGKSTVRVTAETSPKKPATLLIVGDSLTEYSVYPRHILNLSKRGGVDRLQFIGSRGSGNMPPTDELRHEGYSGWTAEAFVVLSGPLARSGYHQRPGTGSPFVYESDDGKRTVDFGRYCAEFNAGKGPDLVTIGLGINDVFTANDESIDKKIDVMFGFYDTILESIRKTSSNTRIGLQMEIPPTTSQDGFRNYIGAGKQTRWQSRRNQHRLMERMIDHYGNRTNEQMYLVPDYVNLDTAHHYPTWSPPINERAGEKMTRVNNGTHPSEAGYQQIGDVVYGWIENMLATMK
jgi:lysophospholipase L1-like esterase